MSSESNESVIKNEVFVTPLLKTTKSLFSHEDLLLGNNRNRLDRQAT